MPNRLSSEQVSEVNKIIEQALTNRGIKDQENIEILRNVTQLRVNGVDITNIKYIPASEMRDGQQMDTPNTNSNYFANAANFGFKWLNGNNYPIMFDVVIPTAKTEIKSIKLILKVPSSGNINLNPRNYYATDSEGTDTSDTNGGVIAIGSGYQQLDLPSTDWAALTLDQGSVVHTYIERNAISPDTIAGDIYVLGALIEFS